MTTPHDRPRAEVSRPPSGGRQIGTGGTVARLILGVVLIGSVVDQQWVHGFDPAPWVLGLLGFPLVLLTWHCLRIRRSPRPAGCEVPRCPTG